MQAKNINCNECSAELTIVDSMGNKILFCPFCGNRDIETSNIDKTDLELFIEKIKD